MVCVPRLSYSLITFVSLHQRRKFWDVTGESDCLCHPQQTDGRTIKGLWMEDTFLVGDSRQLVGLLSSVFFVVRWWT